MPLSRQTSRIVWPSKPSTTRPSTSIRMRGDDCGRCGDCVSSRRSAQRLGRRSGSVARRLSGRVIRSAMGRLIGSHRPPPRSGGRRRLGRRCAGCARPARTGSIASRWTAGGSSAARGRTGRTPRCRPTGPSSRVVSVGRGRPSTTRSAISTSRRVPIRHGIVLPHASPAQNRVSSRARSTTQARSSATTTEPEPMWAPAARSGVEVVRRVEQLGRQQAAGRAADQDGLDRAAGRQSPAEPDDLAQRRPERDLRDAVAGRRPDLDQDRARAVRAADRGERRGAVADDPRDGGEGLDVVDEGRHADRGRSRPGAAAAARAGRACPRGP